MAENKNFVCPHCQENMPTDFIGFHVRNIFNYWLHKCPKCSFKSNDQVMANFHRTSTGHKFEDNNGYNELLEEVVGDTVNSFYRSVAESPCDKKSDRKLKLTMNNISEDDNFSNDSFSPDGNVSDTIIENVPSTPKRVIFLESNYESVPRSRKRKFRESEKADEEMVDDTISELICMSSNINIEQYLSQDVTTNDKKSEYPKKDQTIKNILTLYEPSKTTQCVMCHKTIQESYISRRNHILKNHCEDLKNIAIKKNYITKADVLIAFFKYIKKCFPSYTVCSDFQCIDCGSFYPSITGVKYHIGCCHQTDIDIACPFDDCSFSSTCGHVVLNHTKFHLMKFSKKKHKVVQSDLPLYVTPEKFRIYTDAIDKENTVTLSMSKFFFPIGPKYYKNYENNLVSHLVSFKRDFLKINNPKNPPFIESTKKEMSDQHDDSCNTKDDEYELDENMMKKEL